jgi:calcineurin-like phosphoesterase family protein
MGRITETLPLVASLHGHKVLVAGNHDRCWHGHPKRVEEWTERYLDAGFAEVRQGVVPLEVHGIPVLACHFPYRGDSHDHDRFLGHRPVDHGGWLLHGHVHEKWQVHERMINVGVDVWDFRPVAEDVIAERLTA